MSRIIQLVFAVATLLFVTACSQIDPFADQFQRIAIGDSDARIRELMPPPTSRNAVEVPWVKMEHLAWRATTTDRLYVVITIKNQVAAKAIID